MGSIEFDDESRKIAELDRLLSLCLFGGFQYSLFFVRSTPVFGPSIFEGFPTVEHVPSVLCSMKHEELSIFTHELHKTTGIDLLIIEGVSVGFDWHS